MTQNAQNNQGRLTFVSDPQKILVVLPNWVGDVVMATPFLQALFARFPESVFSFVMHRHIAPLLEASPWQANNFFWPPKGKSTVSKQARKALVAQLRQQQFDLAITLPNSLRSAWLCWRAGAKRRVGFDRDGRGLLFTDRVRVPNKASARQRKDSITNGWFLPMPLVDYYAVLADALGCENSGDQMQLFTTATETVAVQTRLREAGVGSTRPLVVLCPGANFGASKCWSPQRFAAVADELVQVYGACIAISPGPGEEPLAQAIADAMKKPQQLLIEPCLTLGELKSLIADSDLLLGNDTGPRHFARAFDIPRVTVFGPTEERWTDTSHGRETIVRVQVPCGPCHKKVCPLARQDCMEDVTVAMVSTACRKELVAAGFLS